MEKFQNCRIRTTYFNRFRRCFATPISALPLAQKSSFRQLNCGFFSLRSLDLRPAKQLLVSILTLVVLILTSPNIYGGATTTKVIQVGSGNSERIVSGHEYPVSGEKNFRLGSFIYNRILPITVLSITIFNSPIISLVANAQNYRSIEPITLEDAQNSRKIQTQSDIPSIRDQLLGIVGHPRVNVKFSEIIETIEKNQTDIKNAEIDANIARNLILAGVLDVLFLRYSDTTTDRTITLSGLPEGFSGGGNSSFLPSGESRNTSLSWGVTFNAALIPETISNFIGYDIAKLNIDKVSIVQALGAAQTYFDLNLAANKKLIFEDEKTIPRYFLTQLDVIPSDSRRISIEADIKTSLTVADGNIDSAISDFINANANYYRAAGVLPDNSNPYLNPGMSEAAIAPDALSNVRQGFDIDEVNTIVPNPTLEDPQIVINRTNEIIKIVKEFGSVPKLIQQATNDLKVDNLDIRIALKNVSRSRVLAIAAALRTYSPTFTYTVTRTETERETFNTTTESEAFGFSINIIGGNPLRTANSFASVEKALNGLTDTERLMYSNLLKAYNRSDVEDRNVSNSAKIFINNYKTLVKLKDKYDAGDYDPAEVDTLIEDILKRNSDVTNSKQALNIALWRFFLAQNALNALLEPDFESYKNDITAFEEAIADLVSSGSIDED